MSPEEREMLEKSIALGEENNKMLKALTRSMVWTRVMRVFYWALIIGSALGAYYFAQPYMDQAASLYGNAKDNLNSFNSFFESFKK